jgi:hypothetical protein
MRRRPSNVFCVLPRVGRMKAPHEGTRETSEMTRTAQRLGLMSCDSLVTSALGRPQGHQQRAGGPGRSLVEVALCKSRLPVW